MATPTKPARPPKAPVRPPVDDDLEDLLNDWRLSLVAEGKTKETLRNYLGCTGRMLTYFRGSGMSTALADVGRKEIAQFIAALQERGLKDETVAKHYRAIRVFFNWLVKDDVLEVSPFSRMSPPAISRKDVPYIKADDVRKLLAVCSGRDFYSVRDKALITFMFDAGCRVGEVVSMTLDSYDPETRIIRVNGKTGPRQVNAASKTVDVLRRYLRVRRSHPLAATSNAFWLGRYEPIKRPGIAQMLDRRCAEAKVPHIHPHQFRHSFAHYYQAAGGSESNLMSLAGWKSREMVSRYAASAANERARAEHQSLSPADRLL